MTMSNFMSSNANENEINLIWCIVMVYRVLYSLSLPGCAV